MKLIEKQLGRTDIYKGRIIEVAVDDVELENGAKSKRELVMHPGGGLRGGAHGTGRDALCPAIPLSVPGGGVGGPGREIGARRGPL